MEAQPTIRYNNILYPKKMTRKQYNNFVNSYFSDDGYINDNNVSSPDKIKDYIDTYFRDKNPKYEFDENENLESESLKEKKKIKEIEDKKIFFLLNNVIQKNEIYLKDRLGSLNYLENLIKNKLNNN